MIPAWKARVNKIDRNRCLIFQDRESFVNYIVGTFPHDSIVEIFVRKVSRIRSLPQNRYYWGVVIPAIMEWMGEDWDKDQVHFALKEKFLSKRDPDTGLVVVTSTTELTIEQFRAYIDVIIRFFANMGCRIPSPDLVEEFSDNVRI